MTLQHEQKYHREIIMADIYDLIGGLTMFEY